MSLLMQGTWIVTVKSKNAGFPQRFTISHATGGNGTTVVTNPASVGQITVSGASWRIAIEAQEGTVWKPSVMRFKTPTVSGGFVRVDIESNDSGADQDFDDLVLTCSMAQTGSDFVVYGHATAYSGFCRFNPCWRWGIVIDSVAQLELALKNTLLREVIEKLYPERIPGPKNPPDPGPLQTFTPLLLPTPRSPGLPARVFQITETKADAAAKTTTRASARAAGELLDSSITARLGALHDGFTRFPSCTTTTLANYGLRFQEYDRTSLELGGGAYTGTGEREDLGTTSTDSFGNYLFRFSRSIFDVVDEVLFDTAISEDANVQALPDVIAQVLGAGAIPSAETACFFNVPTLRRIDICVPSTNIVLPSSCVDGKIFTFIGKISMTSALNTLDSTGRITAHSTAGNAPTIDCGVWRGPLDLWGCFDTPDQALYTVRWRPLGSGPSGWQFHSLEEKRVIGGGAEKKLGPFFTVTLPVPDDGSPPVNAPHYQNGQIDPTIVQPGAFLKASNFGGGLSPGSYEVRIDTYTAVGALKKSESHTLFIDNSNPDVSITAITLAGVPVNISGTGCTLQTLSPSELSANLDVRFKVSEVSGAILNYALYISRCNEGVAYPTNHLAGGDPAFTWVHNNSVDCDAAPNLRQGTPEDPDADGSGYVTSTLSPVSPWLGASESFTIMRASIGYNWRATNGYSNVPDQSYGPLVWGIQK